MKILLTFVMIGAAIVSYAGDKPTVAFVNVGGAIDSAIFAKNANDYVRGIMPARIKICNAENVDILKIANPATPDDQFGKSTKLFVYFVNDGKLPPQLSAPGRWAIVNVRNLEKDADAVKFKSRIQKMMLKGLAFACGFGANQDIGRCVMGAGSFDTLKGIDGTSASYSPFVAFPMMDFLSARNLLEHPTVE